MIIETKTQLAPIKKLLILAVLHVVSTIGLVIVSTLFLLTALTALGLIQEDIVFLILTLGINIALLHLLGYWINRALKKRKLARLSQEKK